MSSTRFRRIWPAVRNSVNAHGRYHNYQLRQGELRQREAETRDTAEEANRALIAGLQHELAGYREAFSF